MDYLDCGSVYLNNINPSCGNIFGGIKEVYINLASDVRGVTADENGVITNIGIKEITSATAATVYKKFHTYKFRKNTASLTSTATIDDASGSGQIQTDLVLQFNKYGDTNVRLQIQSFLLSNLKVIVLTNEGEYLYLGKDNDVTVTASTSQTGQNFTDGSYYNVTLTDISKELPYIIDKNAFEAVKDMIVEL